MTDNVASSLNVTLAQVEQNYNVRFKYKDRMEWVTLPSGEFEVIKLLASTTFPELIGHDFEIQDCEGAIVGPHFIRTFLQISPVGVVLKLVPPSSEQIAGTILDIASSDAGPSVSPISVFSFIDNRDSCSWTTETVSSSASSFPASPSVSSVASFENDDTSPCRKRAKTAAIPYHKVSGEEVKSYIISHPGGREIISYYKEESTLDDPHRKRLVNIIVDHMLQFLPPNVLPCTETKIDYAKHIVTLFPKLRDKHSSEGFELFFDPISKKGYITNRLRSVFRDRATHRNTSDRQENREDNLNYDEAVINDKIAFLKFATQEQRDDIFKVTEETFNYRNRDRKTTLAQFPRFLDTHGLISFEFSLINPGKGQQFEEIYPKYIDIIKKVYLKTVTNPESSLIKNIADNECWNSATNSLIILVHLLPSPGSRKLKKEKSATAVNKLIKFQYTQVPLEAILEQRFTTQPFILATGTSRGAISNYYVVFDKNIIPCPKNEILTVFQLCFEVHYVYGLEFDRSLEHFYKFIGYIIYDIKVDITNRMRELRTKIDNFMTESSE